MTSRLARNSVSVGLGRSKFLRVNDDEQPLQGQVPLTYQVYSGTGNETLVYDGSNVIVLDSTLEDGVLTIDFSAMYNWLGRFTKFIAFRTLLNNCVLDFGTGQIYFPPFTGSSNTVTLDPASSPTTAEWYYVNPTTAVITHNPTVPPHRIIPGGPGQVLTTNAGTGVVDWEDPASTTPKTLAWYWSTDPANELNNNSAIPVSFVEDNAKNNTTMTFQGGVTAGTWSLFKVVDPTVYDISYDAFIVGDPSICFRGFIGVNSDIYAYKESALGLTGQSLGGSVSLSLQVDDLVGIYIGRATGPTTSTIPAAEINGLVSIKQA